MVTRPTSMNAYEFAVVSGLRAKQLILGCVPRVGGDHKKSTKAQMEVAEGLVSRVIDPPTDPKE
jgi:DNA-directed RNA polymerase subunit K/omega